MLIHNKKAEFLYIVALSNFLNNFLPITTFDSNDSTQRQLEPNNMGHPVCSTIITYN